MPHDPLSPHDLLADEIAQRRESGYEATDLGDLSGMDDERALAALDALAEAPRTGAWAYDEPDALADIRAVTSGLDATSGGPVPDAEVQDRIHAAWLGRVVGCNLGKPVENGFVFDAAALRHYLELADSYPVRDYIPLLDPLPAGVQLHHSANETTRGHIDGSARDDDIDYTILGLHLLETYGRDYTSANVAEEWLQRLPFLLTYTAERATYRNLVQGLRPPAAALYRNPYREWIGAQIRADIHGYVNPGDPARAATSAYPDAALSHVGNGIYGEMWAAALVAAAFTAPDAQSAVETSLRCVPPRSRLAEALRHVLHLHAEGESWEDAQRAVERAYGHYSWVHTVNNAAIVAMGVLWGEGDFTATIGLTVQGAWDTDSNGATAGSVAGALVGTNGIPAHWTQPLDDTVRSAVSGFDGSRISDLAERTIRLVTP